MSLLALQQGEIRQHAARAATLDAMLDPASASDCFREAALTWERVTLTNLRRHQNMTDCRLEYMVFNPRVVGSSPTVSARITGDVAQTGEQRKPLVKNLVGHLI